MENEPTSRIDFEEARARLAGKKGKEYWRSLEELSDTPEFQLWVEDEFPNRRGLADLDRRTFLKYMGASVALAGLAGCRGMFLDEAKVVPYVKMPEELVPGKPLFYATTMPLYGFGFGVLVESHEGRPTKIEGNPDHPASLGSARSMVQASVLGLYDPDRSQNVSAKGDLSNWDGFLVTARKALEDQKASKGSGVRILTDTVTSPTLAGQIKEFLAAYPAAKWHQYEPLARDNAYEGAKLAFGQPVNTVFDFKRAKVVVSLDADFLNDMPGSVLYAREFTDGRRIQGGNTSMNRLYAFESTPTITGAYADHRWGVKPSQIAAIAMAINAGLGGGSPGAPTGVTSESLSAIIKDLKANRGASVVVAGDHQPASVHALVHSINQALGNVGSTVKHTAPIEANPVNQLQSLRDLVQDMERGSVKFLLVMGGNPVYDAPVNYEFDKAIAKVPLKVRYGLYEDETSELCDYHLPATHFLEEWSDVRAFDGTVSIIQPLTAPLFESRSPHELLALLMSQPSDGHEIVQSHWQKAGLGGREFKKAWQEALHAGLIVNTATPEVKVTAKAAAPVTIPAGGMEVVLLPDPNIGDGRYCNNGWLQELPNPITQMAWENAPPISMKDAQSMGPQLGDLIEISAGGHKLQVPAIPQPGQPEGSIAVYLGYGRTKTGTIGEGAGFNAYALRTSFVHTAGYAMGVTAKKVEGYYKIVTTQMHHAMEGRDIIREGTLAEYAKHPRLEPDRLEIPGPHEKEEKHSLSDLENRQEQPAITLYPDSIFNTNLPQWAMTVDLGTCIGCNACVTACQSENNIPIVGKRQVSAGREMQWIRIDRYYGPKDTQEDDMGSPYKQTMDHPGVHFQPMMCAHCETAPCEPVCPVGATIHSHEGLNQMVYNRCVGTRYCSNNCPYKVRRFNFLNFSDNNPQFAKLDPTSDFARGNTTNPKPGGIQLLKMISNPDVTVRGRGVMEKCTYCVQRINDARIEAKKQNREIADGEIVTACQQACPTRTIVFGNMADHESAVSRMKKEPRAYRVLEELNTRPRTSYLGKITNPNPEIKA